MLVTNETAGGGRRSAAFLLAVVAALVGLGLVSLYSASAAYAAQNPRYEDPFFFLRRQVLWLLVAIIAFIVVSHVRHSTWARYKEWLLVATLALLALVLVPGIGVEINGARRWLRVGGWFFQPSEMAKITLAVYVCAYAAARPERIRSFWRGFAPLFGVIAAGTVMIMREPDVGTALFVAMVLTLTLVVAGIRMIHLLPAVAVAGTLVGIFVATHMEYVRRRIEAWRHPELDPLGKGHQIIQSMIALGSGGMTGEGLGEGTQKLFYLPEVHSDFIFPIIGEELGFVGTASVIVLFLLLGFAGWRIGRRAPDRLGFLLSFAITASIMLQAAMNIAVVTAAMPTKGIPLPFMSFGGSSLVFTMVGIGMLVSVARAGEREQECRPDVRVASSSPAAAPAVTSSPE